MRRTKNQVIIVSSAWQVDLSQELKAGFIDYAATKNNWTLAFPDISETKESIARWADTSGLIINGNILQMTDLLDVPYPLVVNHWIPEKPDVYQSAVDPVSAGICAARHLIKGGYRRLATLSCMPIQELSARAEAFYDECLQNQCTCEKFILPETPCDEAVDNVIDWLHAGNFPAAVFCTEDSTGATLIRSLIRAKLYVPEDVAVLGCEDSRTRCEGVRPSLSSVSLPYRKAGFEAARMLDAQLSGKTLKSRQVYLPTNSVTERMSTAVFCTEDPQLRRAVEFIRRHACEEIAVHEVAQHAGLSLRKMQYRFKVELGHSAKEEISRVRMERVRMLLRETDLPLADIAEAVGYQEGLYLSRIFKIKNGLTTRQYRNQCHKSAGR